MKNEKIDYKHTSPEKIILLNEIIKVENWRDLLIKTAEKLIEVNPDCFNKMFSTRQEKILPLSKEVYQFREPRQLSSGLFIETHFSANSIVRVIKKLIRFCGYKLENIEIILKD